MAAIVPHCDDISPIIPYLYLGNYRAATNPTLLRNNGIRHVMSILSEREAISPDFKVETIQYKMVVKFDLPGEDMLLTLPECIEHLTTITKSQQGLLVHCMMGVSRSATVVLGFLMKTNSWPFEKALQVLISCRSVPHQHGGITTGGLMTGGSPMSALVPESNSCKYFLIEPIIWMIERDVLTSFPGNSTGKIPCPHCNALMDPAAEPGFEDKSALDPAAEPVLEDESAFDPAEEPAFDDESAFDPAEEPAFDDESAFDPAEEPAFDPAAESAFDDEPALDPAEEPAFEDESAFDPAAESPFDVEPALESTALEVDDEPIL
ncbi:Protein phosphatase Slingshot 3 [Blomia tropicalis]|nr:Protein phosphatase Slingshot 3 [Blomia tropicalis]